MPQWRIVDVISRYTIMAVVVLMMSCSPILADSGLITKPSKHTVQKTVDKFEAAIKSKAAGGWMVFSRIDHAAAAKDAGLEMRPRTVIIFGNPRSGTPPMTRSATPADEGAGLAGRPRQGLADLQFERIQCEGDLSATWTDRAE
jgi:hypothetical protein